MKTGDEVDLKRRAVRVVDALPGGRLAAAVNADDDVALLLGPVGGKLVCGAGTANVHDEPAVYIIRMKKNNLLNQWSIKVWPIGYFQLDERREEKSHAI